MAQPIPLYIGYDPHERAAVNVLIDSLTQHSSRPLAITPIVARQLGGALHRARHPEQSTEFSFSRFLVPWLQNFQGWAIFMDCDMLCRGDIAELWEARDERYAVQCVQHDHVPRESVKFLGARQSRYTRKNWSSLMLFHCPRCTALTPDTVNSAIGSLPMGRWNHLIDVQPADARPAAQGGPALVHWTLGGPWFRDARTGGGVLAAEWLAAREEAMRLWD